MGVRPHGTIRSRLPSPSRCAAAVVIAIGANGLLGWIFDSRAMRAFASDGIQIKTNTALAILLSGVSLWLIAGAGGKRARWVAVGAAAVVLLIGGLTLVQHLTGFDFGIDQLLFRKPPGEPATTSPNRPGPPASIGFVLAGACLLLLSSERSYRRMDVLIRPRSGDGLENPSYGLVTHLYQGLAVAVGLIGSLSILGYAFGTEALYGLPKYTGIAFHTCLAFVALAAGLLLARPNQGIAAIVFDPGIGGAMARRLLPPAILLPFVLGWLRIQGEQLGLYDAAFGTAIAMLMLIVVFSALVLVHVRALGRADQYRRQAEEAIRKSEAILRAVSNSTEDPIYVKDRASRLLFVNPAMLRFVGKPADQILGRTDAEFYDDPAIGAAILENDRRLMQRGAPHVFEETVDTPCGRRVMLSSKVPWRDGEGQVIGLIGISRDITDRKRMEEQLKSLNETLEQQVAQRTAEVHHRAAQLRAMVAELSQVEQRERRRLSQVLHDHLQQLLVAARMKVQRLQRRAVDDEPLAQIADEIDELIDQCIAESRSLTVELSPPVLYDCGLAAGLDWLGRRVEEKHGLPVEIVADPAANPADVDLRVFLFQAVRELLFNVVKHARATKARVATAKTEDGGLWIEVHDDGGGCDPRQFDGRNRSGGGFGLFNVRERLELLGGCLDVATAPGQGTRVKMVVPVTEPPAGETRVARAGAARQQHGAPAAGIVSKARGGLRVLLADDHPVVRKGLADLLREQAGIEVVIEARDGQEAVDLALEARPDVVIMDVTMPRMDGIEATRRIMAQLPRTRVIGLSMHEDAEAMRAIREAGASHYLRKDVASDLLVAAILCQPQGTLTPSST